MDNDEPQVERVRAEWGESLAATPIFFSDQIIGSYRGDYFVISFGQVQQPQFMPGDEDAIAQLREVGTIPIRTHFRTAVPASDFVAFIDSMAAILARLGLTRSDQEGNDASN